MAQIYSYDGVIPAIDPSAFVHPSAVVIGDVIIGPGVYVAPCASLRGDLGRIIVRAGANIQDTVVVHGFPRTDTVIGELGDTTGDLHSVRHHGMAPFHGTDLDPLLRSLGVSHLVVAGVSLNVGVTGLVIGAVDRGFEVTVATDAVAGVPLGYGDAVLANTLSALATLGTVDAIASRWG